MRERLGQILKIACFVLAALVLYQLASIVLRVNPLRKVAIPALPALAASTNTPAPSSGKGTNDSRGGSGTNLVAAKVAEETGTNLAAAKAQKQQGTNLVSGDLARASATNSLKPLTPALSPSAGARENVSAVEGEIGTSTNAPAQTVVPQTAEKTVTNSVSTSTVLESTETKGTNSTPSTVMDASATNILQTGSATNASAVATGTNFVLPPLATHGSMTVTVSGTNVSLSRTNAGTNSALLANSKKKGTNSASSSDVAMAGMSGGPPGMRGGRTLAPELPPEVKARVDRIYESEMFGQIMRPLPMALMGIAGNAAFLRSPSGQTGLVKEGDSLGEIKLLRIGINRVLVEQDGQKKELMIFEGYGGESLMPKERETPK
jgi:hypothetical protein